MKNAALYMSFISLQKEYCRKRKKKKSKAETHFSPHLSRFLEELLMLRMSFWLNPPLHAWQDTVLSRHFTFVPHVCLCWHVENNGEDRELSHAGKQGCSVM